MTLSYIPYIVDTIPTSRVIRFVADGDDAQLIFQHYGRVVTSPLAFGPHILVVDTRLVFDTVVQAVNNQLQLLCDPAI